jgi:hypothetical protein
VSHLSYDDIKDESFFFQKKFTRNNNIYTEEEERFIKIIEESRARDEAKNE